MEWNIIEGCYGCARCTMCPGIEMDGRDAVIIDQNALCIKEMAQMCPAGVIRLE